MHKQIAEQVKTLVLSVKDLFGNYAKTPTTQHIPGSRRSQKLDDEQRNLFRA